MKKCHIDFHFHRTDQVPHRTVSPKKRRSTRKQAEIELAAKRRKTAARRNTNTGKLANSAIHTRQASTNASMFVYIAADSDSEDTSDLNGGSRMRPSKNVQYNFLVQLGTHLRNV